MKPDEFVQHFGALKASAILRTDDRAAAGVAMDAAVRGGFRILEFTLTTPGALEWIAAFAARSGLVVGAGTVLTVDDARAAVDAGARFLVSPVVDELVIEEATRLGVAVMPGVHTPTEMLRAHRAGAPLQKLFPAPGLGPAYVKACLGPLPFLRIVPTNGCDAGNARAWLAAGSHALGFVAPLFDAAEVRAGDTAAIEARARALISAVTAN
ncbi:MAG: bifunctional 4-hydroxy-2-oxoglutarate aldolase/2-dehydro-3-deoxy-phosphogluconate aldolase [Planctomycetota bacterium]|nr:bifunctional 4-hydroxy-2-oxoglutarate aldolase/2-dehydro-3-deoxy-phosphogluconate aldolase [Planctomycetota bacterium]